MSNTPVSAQDEARRALATELALGIIHATGGDPKRADEAASVILASPLAALRAPSPERAAEEMRKKCLSVCLDLNDAYREAAETYMRASNLTKAREAMDWAIGALECVHEVAKLQAAIRALPVPADLDKGGEDA